MRDRIIALAKRHGADLVGFAPAERFAPDHKIFKIFPETKTVIGMAFRVLRGAYRGIEEGSTYYQYTTMGVETLEETIMPGAALQVLSLIHIYIHGDDRGSSHEQQPGSFGDPGAVLSGQHPTGSADDRFLHILRHGFRRDHLYLFCKVQLCAGSPDRPVKRH